MQATRRLPPPGGCRGERRKGDSDDGIRLGLVSGQVTKKFSYSEEEVRPMKRFGLMLLPLIINSLSGSGWAEETIKIGEVVVTASRLEEAIGETTSEVTVIKGEEIKQMNVAFIPDVLRKVPDLNVVQSGGDGKLTSVFLRGGDPKNTLVMIDGVKVNSPSTGGYDFSGISVEDIERIEIVKGAQSTIYGSEAMAGVINIITKKGEGRPKLDASFEGGSFGTYHPAVTVSGSERALSYRLTAQYLHTDGISAAKDGTERDGYDNASVSWKLGHRPSQNLELELFGNYYSDRSEIDDFDFFTGKAVDAFQFVQHDHRFLLSVRGKLYLFDKWEQVLSLSAFRDSLKLRDPVNTFNEADIVNKRQVIDWQHNLYLLDALTLTGGLEYREEKVENASPFGGFEDTVSNKALYLNSKVKLLRDSLILNAGLRFDDHETAGSKTTYKVGAAYAIKEAGLAFRTSYGIGFRAPSLNDLFFPGFGNANLKPEESKSFDAGVSKTLFRDRLALSLTYFRQDYKDLIQSDPLTFTPVNIARATVRGIETSAALRITDSLDLRAGYTNMDARDKDTNLRLIRRPVDKLSVGAGYTARDFSVLADYIYVGNSFDSISDARNGIKLASYSIVNLSGNYRATKLLTLFARVENLFDEDYEVVKGFGTKGISIYGGIRVNL
jgi:vitamin B12 transporter